MQLFSTISDLGSLSLDILWLPLLLWTTMGLLLISLMKYSENTYSSFQYHGRIALLFALPAGILFSSLNNWLESLVTAGSNFTAKFIVIQSPVSVSGNGAANSFNWLEPTFITGLVTLLLVLGSLILLLRVVFNYITLTRFAGNLNKKELSDHPGVSYSNLHLTHKLNTSIDIAFSDEIEVPFTFGNSRPVIVIPGQLQNEDSTKINMVIRHELMHIRQRDYLVNAFGMVIRALFWFHPLVHKIFNGFKQYREISCDAMVLTDSGISRKSYARLLFELAPKKTFKNLSAVSMAVDSSNLKKRIQIMTNQENKPNLFKTSFYSMLATALLVAGIMGCSDLQDSGITNKDIESAQSTMADGNSAVHPLYVLDGEVLDTEEYKEKVSRIKPEYIKSVNVLKGDKAIAKYGEEGISGVIEFQLTDREKAMSDLREAAPINSKTSFNPKEDYYIVADEMPKVVGGMTNLMGKVNYPEEAIQAGVEGRVVVQFIVTEEGQVENAKVVRGIGAGADEEALRVVKETEFTPGLQDGKPVRVQYSLPVIFKLQKDTAD